MKLRVLSVPVLLSMFVANPLLAHDGGNDRSEMDEPITLQKGPSRRHPPSKHPGRGGEPGKHPGRDGEPPAKSPGRGGEPSKHPGRGGEPPAKHPGRVTQ